LDYEDAQSGIRLKYPASLGLRVDATGQVIVSDGAKQLTVLRTPAAAGARLEDLMARLLKESGEGTTERITTEEQSIRRLGPHEAAYVRETAESKEGKRYTYTYYVLTGEAAYRVTCGTPTVPNPLPWEYLQPDCDSLLQGIVRLGS
jgi:hypothetical protein